MNNILIVDDEVQVRYLLTDLINDYAKETGVDILVEASESYSSALMRGINTKYSLSIFDLKLSNEPNARTGFDLIRVTRLVFPDSKIVVCSAFPEEEQVGLEEYNLEGYIQKPIKTQILYKTLDNVFRP